MEKAEYAGVYAETGIFCDCYSGNFRSLSETTVAAAEKKNDAQEGRNLIHVKAFTYFQNL